MKLSSEKSEKLSSLVNVRRELVKTRVKMKNIIHGMLLSFGIETKARLLNSKKGLEKASTMIVDDKNKIIAESINKYNKKIIRTDKRN